MRDGSAATQRAFADETPDRRARERLIERIQTSVIGDDVVLEGPFGSRRLVYVDSTASGRALSFVESFIRERVLPLHRRRQWFAYEDAIYRRFPDAGLEARHAEMSALGIRMVPPASVGPASTDKQQSVACYRSQLRALATPGRPGAADALAPERHWALIAGGERS